MLDESEISAQVQGFLEKLLKPIPFVTGMEWVWEPELVAGVRADFIVMFTIGGENVQLVGEIKKNLQPRFVHDAVRQVKEVIFHISSTSAYPLVVSE